MFTDNHNMLVDYRIRIIERAKHDPEFLEALRQEVVVLEQEGLKEEAKHLREELDKIV